MSPPPLHGLVLLIGTRGSGKTTLLQDLEAQHRAACPYHPGQRSHFVIADTMGHWLPCPGRTIVDSTDPDAAAAKAIELAPSVLLIDEVWDFYPSDDRPPRDSARNEVIRRGRQAKARGLWRRAGPVALIGATQRPHGTLPALRNLASRLYLFKLTEPEALEWVADVCSHRGGRALAAQLPRLRLPEENGGQVEYLTVDL